MIFTSDLICRRPLQKFVLKLRGGKKSGLYVKDMYSTRKYRQNEIVRRSPLSREIVQPKMGWESWKTNSMSSNLRGATVGGVFRKERTNVNRLIASRSLAMRRLELWLFFLTPRADVYDVKVHSHLLCMLLKEALRRRSLVIKKRREILASYYNNSDVQDPKASLISNTTTTTTEHASVTLRTMNACESVYKEIDVVHGSFSSFKLHHCVLLKILFVSYVWRSFLWNVLLCTSGVRSKSEIDQEVSDPHLAWFSIFVISSLLHWR
jgi:hypothetical protein